MVKGATQGKLAGREKRRRKTKQLIQQEPGGTQLGQTSTKPTTPTGPDHPSCPGQLKVDTSCGRHWPLGAEDPHSDTTPLASPSTFPNTNTSWESRTTVPQPFGRPWGHPLHTDPLQLALLG